jgi:hypothetical protein
MSEWIKIQDEEELRDLPNGTRIRYIRGSCDHGFGRRSRPDTRYICHNEDDTMDTFTGEVYESDKERHRKGTTNFKFKHYVSVEFHTTEKLDVPEPLRRQTKKIIMVDNRTDEEKIVADLILG